MKVVLLILISLSALSCNVSNKSKEAAMYKKLDFLRSIGMTRSDELCQLSKKMKNHYMKTQNKKQYKVAWYRVNDTCK